MNSDNIWKTVLEKRVKASKLKRARTVPQNSEKDLEYQIFEVMIAEALNLCDLNAFWQVTQGGNDQGVDIIGTEKREYVDPLTQNRLYKKILGQVKRHSRGYTYDHFCIDLLKIQKYCINTGFYNNNALLYFIFVLSTDVKNGVYNLKSRLEKELHSKQDSVFINTRPGQIQICDAAELMRIWKMNYSHFEYILSEALTDMQLHLLSNFIDGIDYSWFSVSIAQENMHFVGEAFEQIITINTDMENINIDMLIKWHPAEDNQFQLLSPLQVINPHHGGFPLRIHRKATFKLMLRGLSAGIHDCGFLEFSSTEKKMLIRHHIGKIKIEPGFYPDYFAKPNQDILLNLEAELAEMKPDLFLYAIVGCGGIGKSSLISELMIHAAGRGYSCINISQAKDYINIRLLLKTLFKDLVSLNKFEICLEKNIISEICKHLDNLYNSEWNNDLVAFFESDNSSINNSVIAECLAALLIEASKEQPIFIWLSDLHWSTIETFSIFKQLFLVLKSNKAILYNKILFLFEGRKGEALETVPSVPYDWYQFLENDYISKFTLHAWNEVDSRILLESLIIYRPNEIRVYNQLIDAILHYSKGVPMHMLEQIRFLLHKDKLSLDANQRLIILDNDFSNCCPDEIMQTIHDRIIYFKEKYLEFINTVTIFAIFNSYMPYDLFVLFWERLNYIYPNLFIIIKECDFVKITKEGFSFLHEYYLSAFRENILTDSEAINICIDHFQGKVSEYEALRIIQLKQAKKDINNGEILLDIRELLSQTDTPMIQYELYSMLLRYRDTELEIPNYKIYYELCEIMIKVGSWEKAERHLYNLLEDSSGEVSIDRQYYYTLAYEELANIQCDRMEFDLSIQSSLNGIELTQLCLKNKYLEKTLRENLLSSQEELLARIAVCYWFVGNHAMCDYYQKQCLDSAQSRNYMYSTKHVQYEIATFKLHYDIDLGIDMMQNILNDIQEIPELVECDQGLIEVQQLIGKLIKSVHQTNHLMLNDVILETRRLIDLYKNGHKRTYEEFLCYTIRAIGLFYQGEREQSLFWFFESLKCASSGNMPNLLWKANFNLSQYYDVEGDKAVSFLYAKQTLAILEKANAQNPKNRLYLHAMIKQVIKKLEKLLDRSIMDFYFENSIDVSLLSVKIGENEFVIMN